MSEVPSIRLMSEADLPMVLSWRNAPRVRKFMFDNAKIEPAGHRAWYNRTIGNPLRRLLIVEVEEAPLGFVQFDGAKAGVVSHWGFYARPDAEKGSGSVIGRAALDYAFVQIGLHKVCGLVLEFNEASIRLHQRLGFQPEGFLRKHHRVEGLYHSVVQFGLLQQEWAAAKSALMLKLQRDSKDQIK